MPTLFLNLRIRKSPLFSLKESVQVEEYILIGFSYRNLSNLKGKFAVYSPFIQI